MRYFIKLIIRKIYDEYVVTSRQRDYVYKTCNLIEIISFFFYLSSFTHMSHVQESPLELTATILFLITKKN